MAQVIYSFILFIWFSVFLPGTENQAEIVEESVKHAKEAVTLDVKDGNSWCKGLLDLR